MSAATEPTRTAPLPTPLGFRLLDRGLVPDPVLRLVCTLRTRNRLRVERAGTVDARSERRRALRETLSKGAVATHTTEANAQHYEVPTAFYEHVLGARRKYSSCYFPRGDETLDEAELAMLELYGERAGLTDGQRILELGCGWGSFCLWAAQRYPASEIVTVSNSRTQRRFIEAEADRLGLTNLTVITADISEFDPADLIPPAIPPRSLPVAGQLPPPDAGPAPQPPSSASAKFDRIVSIEMLEHVRNHEQLFARIARWLAPDGRFFAHIFTGADVAFRYDADDPRDWMGRYFFSGGIMPSDDLFLHLQGDLVCTDHWQLSGTHYEKTANAWLANMNDRRAEVLAVLAADGGRRHAKVWFRRWTAFFMGCAQLWGYNGGQDFGVSHYLFAPRPRTD